MSLPGLAEKVAFLSRPASYPLATRQVETKETHMSWIFLTDTQAWKLKKPVRYDYLDFSTPAARRHHCQEEVRLNRRLAPNVYPGVVPLTMDAHGNLQLAGKGKVIDWLVQMRRLAAHLMLDRAIADQTVSREAARKVGMLLARFYQRASPVAVTAAEYRQRLAADIHRNQEELSRPEYELSSDEVKAITAAQLQFLQQHAALFDERVRTGRIIEAHGDLRPEHICLESEPVIIDCLEFNRDFRVLDSASELAFLALECERLGAAEIGTLIMHTCCAGAGDRPPASLLAFYRSWHACLRAKIAVWHLRNKQVTERAKWIERATQYLSLASRFRQTADALSHRSGFE